MSGNVTEIKNNEPVYSVMIKLQVATAPDITREEVEEAIEKMIKDNFPSDQLVDYHLVYRPFRVRVNNG